MFSLFVPVSHTGALSSILPLTGVRAEDYIKVMLDRTDVAENLKYIDELAIAELQMTATETYVITRQGNGPSELYTLWV